MIIDPSIGSEIAKALAEYAGAPSVEEFLDRQIGPEQRKAVLDFLERIDLREAELKTARKGGVNTARWLGQQLAKAGGVPAENEELLSSLAPGISGDGAEQTGQRILTAAQSALGMGAESIGATESVGAELLDLVTDAKAAALVDSFLTTPVGHAGDRNIVAAAAGGVIRGAEKLGLKGSAVQLTGMVDMGFRFAKAAYQVGSGELSGVEAAMDLVVDRVAAQVGAVAGMAAERGLEAAGTMVGTAIGTLIPSLATVAPTVGRQLGSMAGKVARPIVAQGVRRLTNKAVKVGRRVLGRVVKTAAVVVAKTVKKWLFA